MGGLRGLRIAPAFNEAFRALADDLNYLYQVVIVLCSPWGKIKLAINCHLWD